MKHGTLLHSEQASGTAPAAVVKVLVIDDSCAVRAHVRDALAVAGMEVYEQSTGIGATRTILQNGIDAVVFDASVTGLPGDKLVGLLRSNPKLRGLTIVIISAKPWDELQALSREYRADAVISKGDVKEKLASILQRSRRTWISGQYRVGDPG